MICCKYPGHTGICVGSPLLVVGILGSTVYTLDKRIAIAMQVIGYVGSITSFLGGGCYACYKIIKADNAAYIVAHENMLKQMEQDLSKDIKFFRNEIDSFIIAFYKFKNKPLNKENAGKLTAYLHTYLDDCAAKKSFPSKRFCEEKERIEVQHPDLHFFKCTFLYYALKHQKPELLEDLDKKYDIDTDVIITMPDDQACSPQIIEKKDLGAGVFQPGEEELNMEMPD